MKTRERAQPAQFKLYPRHDEKLNRIADHMAQQRGEPVSRSEALRSLIDQFSLPACSLERIQTPERTAA
jgi:hypothetical protein